jgi:glyoxylase-like metal-dependent hydrolase (beta-lactamase superfamily II)
MTADPPEQGAAGVLHPEPMLRVLRAPNPSAMTGAGTNSYLVGSGRVAVIDPGPDDPAHLAALLAALAPGETVAQIIVTHAHADHSGLARPLARATGAPVLGFGLAVRAETTGVATGLAGGEGIDRSFVPDRRLADGDVVEGDGWALRAIHTPGHLSDHLCLGWGDLCFTGDHVMGWSTSLVSPPEGDMGDYLKSLARLAREPWRRFLPGHGPGVDDPAGRIAELTAHRRQREAEILTCLRAAPATPTALTALIYATTPASLRAAAERNVLAHLIDLKSRNLVDAAPGPARTAVYSAV